MLLFHVEYLVSTKNIHAIQVHDLQPWTGLNTSFTGGIVFYYYCIVSKDINELTSALVSACVLLSSDPQNGNVADDPYAPDQPASAATNVPLESAAPGSAASDLSSRVAGDSNVTAATSTQGHRPEVGGWSF